MFAELDRQRLGNPISPTWLRHGGCGSGLPKRPAADDMSMMAVGSYLSLMLAAYILNEIARKLHHLDKY